ncbi:MAG: hypothetical protein V7776_10680 [Halopseudomonas aestusnigri]
MLLIDRKALFILSFLLSVMPTEAKLARAQFAVDCPATLATVNNGFLSDTVGEKVKEIYKNLNCRVKLVQVPGRRGIALFNIGRVNGEVMRLEKVEPLYSRDFVRSKIKLLNVHSSLWVHPNMIHNTEVPVGYTFGVIWQEKYVEGRRARKFNNNIELFSAYSSGETSSFLAADITVVRAINNEQLEPAPIRLKLILSAPLYHYLGSEFSPFMIRFSEYLEKNDPFTEIIKFQN